MAASKKDSPKDGAAANASAGSMPPVSPLLYLALLLTLLYGAWYAVWYWGGVGARVHAASGFLAGPESISVTPLPRWIHADIRMDAYRELALDGPVSVMDDRLVQRARDVFALHPWVSKVLRVTKQHPARLIVDLEYRCPVCMVEVPGGLYPVDVEGVWLPSDFSPVEASAYPRLSGINTQPAGSIGMRWGDARVTGGAEIAAALAKVWSALQLQTIVPVVPAGSPGAESCTFEVYTRKETRGATCIVWGRAPSASTAGELPAAEKVARLTRYAEEHGGLIGTHGPQEIDLRDPKMLRVLPRAAGKTVDGRG